MEAGERIASPPESRLQALNDVDPPVCTAHGVQYHSLTVLSTPQGNLEVRLSVSRHDHMGWGGEKECSLCDELFTARTTSQKVCDECKDPKSPAGRWIRMKKDAHRRRLAFKITPNWRLISRSVI